MNMEDRIDLSKLGFEIIVPATAIPVDIHYEDHDGYDIPSSADLGYEDLSVGNHLYENSVGIANIRIKSIDQDVAYEILSDDMSEYTENDYAASYTTSKETGPARVCRRHIRAKTPSKQGSHEESAVVPTTAQLGYDDETMTSSIHLLSVGRPVRNRRSMGRRMSRFSSACSSGASSCSSLSEKKAHRRHSRSRPSQRERMVTRSVSRRLSRKTPSQVSVITMDSHCSQDNNTITRRNSNLNVAYQQTLQDLGCSEIFLDPTRQHMPRRVSLEYDSHVMKDLTAAGGDSVTTSHVPRRVSLEFDNSSLSIRSRLPRRISLSYDQVSNCTCWEYEAMRVDDSPKKNDCHNSNHSEDSTNPKKGRAPPRLLRRRGSLDFSLGTSCLSRRRCSGKAKTSTQQDDQVVTSTPNSTKRRPGRHHSSSISRTSSGVSSQHSQHCPRRSSVAHIPRKQIGQRRPSFQHEGAVESLTRDSLVVGRLA